MAGAAGFVPRLIGKTGDMRRVLLVAVLIGGLAVAGASVLGAGGTQPPDRASGTAALARAELADVPAPSALGRVRDAFGRDHHAGHDVPAALAVAFLLTLAGGWWLARDRAARVRHPEPVAYRRTRAPPVMPATVHG